MGLGDCLENLNIPPCVWFEGDRKNAYAAMVAGFLFSLGWWIIIDASSVHPGSITFGYHLCGILGTVSLVMVNSVTNAQFRGDAYEGGCLGSRGAKLWLFLGFVLGFASVIASCWILFAVYVSSPQKVTSVPISNGTTTIKPPLPVVQSSWPGVALFLENAFIFIASLIYKFGRSEDMWN
ncbi:transmembrane protein 50A [Coccinella septempunctata]|uniref:transmembrane protein 50A n=1 Tax=Coccinella septempunctata TaxID=41139 RepID=UPI001D06E73D|nr:transmembrane protein 50A [Coccinella septempunctata]